MAITPHFHHGYGYQGYGPTGEDTRTAETLTSLAEDVSRELGDIATGMHEEAQLHARDAAQLRSLRPSNGSDPKGYPGSWESIAEAYRHAWEASETSEEVSVLRLNLSADRASAPLYRGNPAAWQETLRHMLLTDGTYPLATSVTGGARFYVWECADPRCTHTHADYPHEAGRLNDCLACEFRCYCTGDPGHTECVHCAMVASGETVCIDTDDCEAHHA